MTHWVYLALAIVFEVFATTMLKVAAGAPSWAPEARGRFGYGAAFVCLGFALRVLPVGVAYAIWSGVGTALVAWSDGRHSANGWRSPAAPGLR